VRRHSTTACTIMAAPSSSEGAAGASAPRTRLIITHMTLENFKSYAGVQQIGPFHKVSAGRRTRAEDAPRQRRRLPAVFRRAAWSAARREACAPAALCAALPCCRAGVGAGPAACRAGTRATLRVRAKGTRAPRSVHVHFAGRGVRAVATQRPALVLGPPTVACVIARGLFWQRFSSVVGPNGSGKSNVIDAMLFVFGKRAKQLRLNKVGLPVSLCAHPPHRCSRCLQRRAARVVAGG
jgi:AAA15 family ATPase/GTPase